MNFWLLQCHMRCNPWEKTPTKISHSTSSCTGSDDPALGRMIRPCAERFCKSVLWVKSVSLKYVISNEAFWQPKIHSNASPLIVRCILKFKLKIKIKSPIESTILKLKLGTFFSSSSWFSHFIPAHTFLKISYLQIVIDKNHQNHLEV